MHEYCTLKKNHAILFGSSRQTRSNKTRFHKARHVADPRCYFVGQEYSHQYSSLLSFFKWLYQRFLTSLSVRSRKWAAILYQLQHKTKTPQTDQVIISYDNGKVWGWFSLPIPIAQLEADNGVVFLLGEVLSLNIRIQVVFPPLLTTLTTPAQPC